MDVEEDAAERHQGSAMTFKDFRPIALCDSLYKFITKIIANRMKEIRGRLLSTEQAAFLLLILTLRQFLTVHEVVNSLDRLHGASTLWKLDMSKVHDRVNWRFLRLAVEHLGLHELWVDRICSRVTSASQA
ncbi:hypothetical protein EJ110_NYTH08908 [Nymphaea thermarum]|nr:hypothetical protein EJ110_NYTH08908 [Nymphaea thermarum]